MNDLSRTHVVTAFLRHAGKILLVRRSEKVGSYRGCWAGISGYLEEPTARAQALREIHEETGLHSGEVHLVADAAPLEIPQPSFNRLWVVHAFLFDVDDPDAVRLDWESETCAWIDPGEIGRFETVPMLTEALQACLRRERHAIDR